MAPIAKLAREVAVVAGGIALIAAGARADVPMYPVPMTLQTLAVVALAAVAGLPRALAATTGYLAAALLGLPVLADGSRAAGLDFLDLPSGGYVLGFVLGAGLVAAFAPGTGYRPAPLFLLMLGGHAVIVAAGVAWLASFVGTAAAVRGGLAPFVAGMVVKSAAAAGIAVFWARRRARAGGRKIPGMDLASVRIASAAPAGPERTSNR